jgi:polyphenol oxidase
MTPLQIIHTAIFRAWPDVTAAMSTRLGGAGDSPYGMNLSLNVGDDPIRVERNRETFFGSMGVNLYEVAIPQQVHSATVQVVHRPGMYPSCDALMTQAPRVFVCVTVADCLPILMFDPQQQAVAAVHAGWRGTAARIAEIAIVAMREHFGTDPRDLLVFIGPGAGSCCYVIGEEVASQVDARFVHRRDSTFVADLKAANCAQLESLGVPRSQIEIHPACTISEPEVFHSYRRDRERSGRMMAVVGLSSAPIR